MRRAYSQVRQLEPTKSELDMAEIRQ